MLNWVFLPVRYRLGSRLVVFGCAGSRLLKLAPSATWRRATRRTRYFRQSRIVFTHASAASISFLSSAAPGTGARAAGALS
jgi:hypothetical protein